MAESYDAKLYDQAMLKIAQDSTVYSTTAEADLKDDKIKMIETTAREIYIAFLDSWPVHRAPQEQAQDKCKFGDSIFTVRYVGIA